MSFFEKISVTSNNSSETLIESVIRQIEILFSNRNDRYWAYDFKKKEIVAIHEVFSSDYFSPDFAEKLANAIEAFDARLSDVKVEIAKTETGAKAVVSGMVQLDIDQHLRFTELIFYL